MASKGIVDKALASAMGAEVDVAVPSDRARSSSMTSALVDLRVGQVASRAVQVDGDTAIGDLNMTITAEKDRLRNNVQSSVNGAKRRAVGAEYKIECAHLLMSSGVYVVAMVTRMA